MKNYIIIIELKDGIFWKSKPMTISNINKLYNKLLNDGFCPEVERID